VEHFVEDHLRESACAWVGGGVGCQIWDGIRRCESNSLRLNILPPLSNLLRNILNLHDRIRLHDPQQILLEQRVVQRGEV
jgi:hypothetical protein